MDFEEIFDRGSYLREPWNQLDFFIVVSSLIDMCLESVDIPMIKILRLLRTLRPLRFISHNINLKIVVTALLESVSAIINVLIVLLLIWLMFAILAINLLKDRFKNIAMYLMEITMELIKQNVLNLGTVGTLFLLILIIFTKMRW